MRLDPTYLPTRLQVVRAHLRAGRPPTEAIAGLEELLAEKPDWAEAWLLLEETLGAHGTPEALEDCRRRMRALGVGGGK